MEPTEAQREQDEKVEAAGVVAVQMQLAATRRVGLTGLALLVAGAVVSWYSGSWWWMLGAVVLTFVAFHFIMQSCARYVSRSMGMPPEIQSYFARMYKTDAMFKQRVDAFTKR